MRYVGRVSCIDEFGCFWVGERASEELQVEGERVAVGDQSFLPSSLLELFHSIVMPSRRHEPQSLSDSIVSFAMFIKVNNRDITLESSIDLMFCFFS